MRHLFIICRLIGFAADIVSRGFVHRSLYCAGKDKTLLRDYSIPPNASKSVGIHVFDILTAVFLVWLIILYVIYKFLLYSFVDSVL